MPNPPFIDAIATCPPPHDRERVARASADLATAAAEADGAVADAISTLSGDAAGAALLAAVFGNSPFLTRTLLRETAFLPALLSASAAESFAAILAAVEAAPRDAASQAEMMQRLRVARRRVALLVAMADIAGMWQAKRVVEALTAFADASVQAAVRWLLRQLHEKGDLALADPARADVGSGLAVIAMGKFGAHELNYSSDIDFVMVFDQDVTPYAGKDTPQASFIRLSQALVKLLQEATADGYVFRTDLRLRPDPGVTPTVISMMAAEQYYESMGQNWERAAMIKARAAAGDIPAGEAYLARLAPFIWRKNLDFAAIEDVHSIKSQIHAHRGLGRIVVPGQNIKLGPGGIRDIEFFAQTQQLIAGGRDPDLRERTTCGALRALASAGWIDDGVADALTECYWFHRKVEHRLQMVGDEQTHSLPDSDEGLTHIARFMGYDDRGAFEQELLARLNTVRGHYAALFQKSAPLAAGGNLVFTGTEDDPETLETLRGMGFERPDSVSAEIRGWHHGRYRATRSTRSRELLTKLMPALLATMAKTADPDATFGRFGRFLEGLPSGVQLFSLLFAHPNLLDLMAAIMGAAPRLANYLSRSATVLDAVLEPDFFNHLPPCEILCQDLQEMLRTARDFEDVLDVSRRWTRERRFQLGVQVLNNTTDADTAGRNYADVAEAVITDLCPRVEADFAARHGRVPGGGMAMLAMGKLGGREMSATSDLDLIFIYDYDASAAESDGDKPLAAGHYFTRLSQRLLNALTVQTSEGALYEVDMRLRPSGNAGPVATQLETFRTYQCGQAWTWEHMALTRARVVAGPPALTAEITAMIDEVLRQPRDPAKIAADVVDMRTRLAREKPSEDPWELKQVRGGLIDLEFVAQYLQLVHAASHADCLDRNTGGALAKLGKAGVLPADVAGGLVSAVTLIRGLTGVLRIAMEGPFDPETSPQGLRDVLTKVAGEADFAALDRRLRATQASVHQRFQEIVEAAAG